MKLIYWPIFITLIVLFGSLLTLKFTWISDVLGAIHYIGKNVLMRIMKKEDEDNVRSKGIILPPQWW